MTEEPQYERRLGKIELFNIGPEDHGIFTFLIMLDFGGSAQGFGTIALDTWDERRKRRVGTDAGLDCLIKLFALIGSPAEARGLHVYALRKPGATWSDSIIGLQRTEPDGGARFLLSEWQDEWFSEKT